MIKRLLSTGLVFAGLYTLTAQDFIRHAGVREMSPQPFVQNYNLSEGKAAMANIQDTLYYFQRKNYYRNVNGNSYYTYKSPYPSASITLDEFGDTFLNGTTSTNGTPITVTGAYILTSRAASSTSSAVPLMVYIYSASPFGMPIAKLDSATTVVTSTLGNYVNATFANPVVVNGAFHISYKPMPIAADTLLIWYNNGATATSTLPVNQRYGEGLSYVRSNLVANSYTPTTDFLGGTGADRETIVLPTVSFNYTVSAVMSAPNSTITPGDFCSGSPVSFTNTSGNISVIENRQFNYNKFRPYWAPYTATVSIPPADSIYNWSFGGVSPLGTYTTKNAAHTFTGTGTGSANLTVKYQRQTKVKFTDSKTYTMTVSSCSPVGINANSQSLQTISVYPNPVVNGKANISGLEGINTIKVYNMLGQVIINQTTNKEVETIDLSNQMKGNYLVRITDSDNHTKTIKIINN